MPSLESCPSTWCDLVASTISSRTCCSTTSGCTPSSAPARCKPCSLTSKTPAPSSTIRMSLGNARRMLLEREAWDVLATGGIISRELMLVADALRLGGAILGSHPDMLAPQLIGRLLPEIGGNVNVKMLLRACDNDGAKDCSLLPVYHCLHTPGGPLKVIEQQAGPINPSTVESNFKSRFEKCISFYFLKYFRLLCPCPARGKLLGTWRSAPSTG